ncbi:TetR/AcrR family transcriptional regulator [Goodfellowiella coeruleoviolacea]|uniref:Transcriptional regulator, TetR family n=1 Tax=Goodfellowiella coeruleoviolacea TaxID=334858 RepID=A0AAE3GJ81_9PSEU|nr:TetR/AcrR family transcriptional regulator [Goodfellowiella coeruleoviolacea]MCP2168402.1 transcriptional regulator, TetR family [Goodfellowiella coeruleoviolacea]
MEEAATPRLTRSQRRRRTEERILARARELFAESGYERTTIRAVAARAGVDPALVMQYFGAKDELFRRAVAVSTEEVADGGPERLVERLLAAVGVKLGEQPPSSLALLRSMLTHPEATEHVRTSISGQLAHIQATIPGEDAELRAALIVATLFGVTLGRHLLDLDALRDVPPERIAALLRPAFTALAEGQATSDATGR